VKTKLATAPLAMNTRLSSVLTATLIASVVITTGLVVRRELFDSRIRSSAVPSSQSPTYIEDWKRHLERTFDGATFSVPVQVVEFIDLECSFCARYQKDIKMLRARYPTQVKLTYVHLPLPMHPSAEAAARAAECAGQQGRFEEMLHWLFAGQAEFELARWDQFARDAGVPDLTTFNSCIQSNEPVPRIIAGRRLAEEFNIQATPTIVINGWKFPHPPTSEHLDRIVRAVLAGKSPASVSD